MADFDIYGPGVPGRLARITPGGRKKMRFALTTHLLALRDMNAPAEQVHRIEALLVRYGGQPPASGDPFKPQVEGERTP